MQILYKKEEIKNKENPIVYGIFNDGDLILDYNPELHYIANDFIDFNKFYLDENNELKKKEDLELYQVGLFTLEEGWYFDENKSLIKIPRPHNFCHWDEKEKKWIDNLEYAVEFKEQELKRIREEKIEENIVYNGNKYQVRSGDLRNLDDAERAIVRGAKTLDDMILWRMADNSEQRVTYRDLQTVIDMRALRKPEIYGWFIATIHKLYACKTVKEVMDLKWGE